MFLHIFVAQPTMMHAVCMRSHRRCVKDHPISKSLVYIVSVLQRVMGSLVLYRYPVPIVEIWHNIQQCSHAAVVVFARTGV